jgi:hypothetical protein
VEPVLRLWLENDGSTAHLVNAAGAKIVSGHLVPEAGGEEMVKFTDRGGLVRCALRFEGTVV